MPDTALVELPRFSSPLLVTAGGRTGFVRQLLDRRRPAATIDIRRALRVEVRVNDCIQQREKTRPRGMSSFTTSRLPATKSKRLPVAESY